MLSTALLVLVLLDAEASTWHHPVPQECSSLPPAAGAHPGCQCILHPLLCPTPSALPARAGCTHPGSPGAGRAAGSRAPATSRGSSLPRSKEP